MARMHSGGHGMWVEWVFILYRATEKADAHQFQLALKTDFGVFFLSQVQIRQALQAQYAFLEQGFRSRCELEAE